MVGMQSGTVTMEPVWQFLKKLNYHMTQQFCSKVYNLEKWNIATQKPCMNADSSIIHKSQKSGSNLNIHQLMDKQMVYPCVMDWIVFPLKSKRPNNQCGYVWWYGL